MFNFFLAHFLGIGTIVPKTEDIVSVAFLDCEDVLSINTLCEGE